ncbi:MAG: hypothetical protein PHZ00_05650 [Candidatus Peribacteraceae bacterium]|nr:hypothetical protein [Candidatus Peribacteraceae bacterium]
MTDEDSIQNKQDWVAIPLHEDVPSLDPDAQYFTNDREGWHCKNYHMLAKNPEGRIRHSYLKVGVEPCDQERCERLQDEHKTLRDRLGEIVPSAVFIHTQISEDGTVGALVITQPVDISIDVCDTAQCDHLRRMMKDNNHLLPELQHFLDGIEGWEAEGKILDLSGEENLVVTDDGHLRYIDSFEVFLDPSQQRQAAYVQASKERAAFLRDLLGQVDGSTQQRDY